MTCSECTAAAQRPHYGFRQGCKGCCARAAARSPHFRRCQDSGIQDRAYRRMLDQFELQHAEVVEAAGKDRELA